MKSLKRLSTIILALVMALSLTIPGFAAEATEFTDVPAGSWYEGAVKYVYDNKLMDGVGGGRFNPGGDTSRAMLVTILWRMEGKPVVNYLMQFPDVAANDWYTEAVRWAASENIVGGYDNGNFGANDPVSREQIVTILWRYKGSPTAQAGQDFADESSISGYAAQAVNWARAVNVINGRDGNRFAPQDSASRAEVAMTLMNYLQTKQDQPGNGPAVAPSRPDGNTVATAVVTPHAQQTLYLWEEGNVPAVTEYTVNNGSCSDDPDFRPYLTFCSVSEGTAVKGAVLICPGGAFMAEP